MKRIAIIGSTGSIGTQALDVIKSNYANFRVVALASHKNDALLSEQLSMFGVKMACLYDREASSRLKARERGVTVLSGDQGLVEIANLDIDLLLVAGNGPSMIEPTFEALRNGTRVALATKEVVVCAGHLIEPSNYEEKIIPVDSEPSAIFQSLIGEDRCRIKEILLTASGGPFFSKGMTWNQLSHIRPEDAMNHPKWKMGKRITIDSATLVNKGLELIEVCRMFDVPPEKVRVLVHPQAEVHSGVMMVDGSAKLQASPSDMRYPISYALHFPGRTVSDLDGLKFPANWSFGELTGDASKSVVLAKSAFSKGPSWLVAYTAADEAAIELFLSRSLSFGLIPEVISKTMSRIENIDLSTTQKIISHYANCRQIALEIGKKLCQQY